MTEIRAHGQIQKIFFRFWLGAQHLDRMGASWPQHLAEFASKGRGVGMYGCGENAKSLALKKHFIMFRLGYLMRIVATWAFTVPRKVYFFFFREGGCENSQAQVILAAVSRNVLSRSLRVMLHSRRDNPTLRDPSTPIILLRL